MRKQFCIFALMISTFIFVANFTAIAEAEPILIAVIGDSNVAGKGVMSSDAYPAKLERALRAKGYDVRVSNMGITGDTTSGVLSRLDSAAPQGTQVAIVWVGINDLRAGMADGAVEANRQAIASRLRARGIGVVLVGPRHGLRNQPQFLLGDPQNHLNPAGYDVIVGRTLPQIQALIDRVRQKSG